LQNTVSLKVPPNILNKVDWAYFSTKLNVKQIEVKSPYELTRFSSVGVAIVVYNSGKIVLQGNNITESFIINARDILGLKPESIKKFNDSNNKAFVNHIGVDEVGKGDFFGPMVVCAAFVSSAILDRIQKSEIQDSKKLSDSVMCDLYDEFAEEVPHSVSVVTPEIYNIEYPKIKNVSILLAQNHAKCIEELLEILEKKDIKCEKIVIDQFSKKKDRVTSLLGKRSRKIKFEQFHKGESDIAVAVASVFARAIFVKKWQNMDETYGFKFPKGATHVIDAGKQFVTLYGKKRLGEVAKMSFRTSKQVLNK